MIDLNLIYTDHSQQSSIIFENDIGRVWMNKNYNGNMANIAMNSYSALKVQSNDSILILEPICVLDQNYNINFLKQFRFIFTWATKAFDNTEVASKVVYTNFPSYRKPVIDKTNWLPWNERSDEIVFIANNKSSHHPTELYSLRLKLADWLHANSHLKVSWYGNMPINRPYYRGPTASKFDVLRKVKYHVCIENCYDPVYSYNYVTEKLPDAWMAGTIPLYLGCINLNELGIPPGCYFDLTPFRNDFRKLEERLKIFSADEHQLMTKEYFNLSDLLYKLTSYENVFEIMLKSYC